MLKGIQHARGGTPPHRFLIYTILIYTDVVYQQCDANSEKSISVRGGGGTSFVFKEGFENMN
jgi:hypothetical protein